MEIRIARGVLIIVFLLAAAAVASLLAVIYLPAATITIHPLAKDQVVEQTILLSTTTTTPDFIHFTLPAKILQKDVQVSKVFTRPGNATEDFAHGVLDLINNSNEDQGLLPKTHLRHEASGAMFLTDNAIRVPAHSQLAVPVTAEQKGVIGNVPAGKFIIDRLPTSAQSIIFGQSTQDFSGGLAVDTPLAESEITEAKSELEKQASTQALTELAGQTGGIPIRPELLTTSFDNEQISATAGSKVASFSVSVTLHAHGFIVDDNDLLGLTLLALRSQSNPAQDFVSYKPESFKISVTRADFTRNTAEVKGSLVGSFAQKISTDALDPKNIIGLSKAEALDHFKQISGVGDVDISLSPFWVQTIPGRTSAVQINLASNTTGTPAPQ